MVYLYHVYMIVFTLSDSLTLMSRVLALSMMYLTELRWLLLLAPTRLWNPCYTHNILASIANIYYEWLTVRLIYEMIPCRQSCTLSVGHATPIFECKINTFLALWTNFKPGASNLSVKPSITSCGIKETHQSFCSTDNGIGIYTMTVSYTHLTLPTIYSV